MGLAVALDELGTGRATLGRFRPDYLKLDMSVVRSVHENLIQQQIASSVA
jgi:EAL domain-containing protein (putative c-di-GMP-specific phosphodiesterase class I)